MKRIIFTITLLTFLSVNDSIAQCDNNVSTNPTNPTNNALPDDPASSSPYTMDNRFLNGLDWWSPSSYNLTNMEFNPGQPYGSMANIQTINQQQYYTYLKHNPLNNVSADQMNPENGWELLLVNLGRYPDDVTTHNNGELNVVPYLLFYHRYTGVIRVFVRYGNNTFPNDAINGVKINLYYNTDGAPNNLSGLFRLGDGLDRTLDQTTKVSRLSAVAPPNGQSNFWLSADFQTAYDPCVCHYPTDIKLDFEYFSTTSLKLYGRGISTEEELIGTNGNIINNDFLGGVDFSSQMNAENGFVIYKNMIRLIEDYSERLQDYNTSLIEIGQHNEEVERNLAIINVAKIVLTSGITAATGTSELTSLITLFPNINAWNDLGHKTFWKELDKVLFQELDLLVKENFSEKSTPQAPTTPTASFSEMYFEGELLNILPINGPQFHTPGSFKNENNTVFNGTNSVYSYPVYNNPLGVFALLEKPKIEVSNTLNLPESCSNTIVTINGLAQVTQTFEHSYFYQFKLKDELSYTFNPSLDISDYSIEGSVVLEFETLDGNELVDESEYITGSLINGYSPNIPGSDNDRIFKVISTPIPIDGLLGFASEFRSEHSRRKYYSMSQTDLHQLETLCTDNINEINHNDYTRPRLINAYLKLSINVDYNDQKDNGDPHLYNYNYTYQIDVDDISQVEYSTIPIVDNLSSSSINLSNYEYNLELNGVDFNGQNISGCTLDNYLYLCKAENNVQLQGVFNVDPGYEVIIQAANEITEMPETEIPSEMILQIASFHELSNPMPPVDETYVSNFCNDNNAYKARVSNFPIADNDSVEIIEEHINDNFAFTIFPNPTGGSATAVITLNEVAKGELFITDMNGKKLGVVLENQLLRDGENNYSLPTENLASGIYLVHLFVDGEHHVKRLVKQ